MSREGIYWGVLFSVILSGLIFILGLDRKDYANTPTEVYQVYLNGETIGVIANADELYDLIDTEQENLKKEFDVKKIYAPLGLETTKLVTYEGKVDSVNEVYDKVKDVEPFTVKGYEVTIVHSEDNIQTLNVLKKEILDEAVDNTIKAFVDEEDYEKYIQNKQDKLTGTGKTINNISVREKITLKEKYLSTEEKIYTDVNELSKLMLFGTDEAQGTHIVKMGETIKSIAEVYELNVKEFLIVNSDILSENSLLFPGQEVNVGLINPIISIVVENNLIEDTVIKYETETHYDNKLVIGTTYTEQQGQNGLSRVTYKTETINGTITQVERVSSETITPVINEIIKKGGLPLDNVGDGLWKCPTNSPYIITEYFGWRTDPVFGGREFHRGIDISGTGYNSPIYAAQSGTVSRANYAWDMGNVVVIDHPNGCTTIYMHLAEFAPYIRVGYTISAGEVLGGMGSTGKSTGTHLDFRVQCYGEYIDPLLIYD